MRAMRLNLEVLFLNLTFQVLALILVENYFRFSFEIDVSC